MKRTLFISLALLLAAGAFAADVKTDDKPAFPTFKFNGWIKANYSDMIYHETDKRTSTFEVKDAALQVSADVWSNVSARLLFYGNRKNSLADRSDNPSTIGDGVYSARLFDAYIDWKPSPYYSFRIGQYKKPFGYEHWIAVTNWDFISSSQVTANFMSNNRDQGAMAFGKWNDLSYWLSLGNGAAYNFKDKNWAKDAIAHVGYAPLPGLAVGASVEYGTNDAAGASSYRRHGGIDVSYEWRNLYVRGEYMIGRDDRSAADSLSRVSSRSVTDTVVSWTRDTISNVWVPSLTFRYWTMPTISWTRRTMVDGGLIRGGYVSAGYVVLPGLRLGGRCDLYRSENAPRLKAWGTDTLWIKTDSRTIIYTVGADYFLNPGTKLSVNYDIKQEDLALAPYKNNVLLVQLQAKF